MCEIHTSVLSASNHQHFFLPVTTLSNPTVICDEPGGDSCELLINTMEEEFSWTPQCITACHGVVTRTSHQYEASSCCQPAQLTIKNQICLRFNQSPSNFFLKGFSLSNAVYGLFICLKREIDTISSYSVMDYRTDGGLVGVSRCRFTGTRPKHWSSTDGSCRCDIIVSSMSLALYWTSTEHQHHEGMCRNEGLSSQPWMTPSFLCAEPRGPEEENDTNCAPSRAFCPSYLHLPILRGFLRFSDVWHSLRNKASCSNGQSWDTGLYTRTQLKLESDLIRKT